MFELFTLMGVVIEIMDCDHKTWLFDLSTHYTIFGRLLQFHVRSKQIVLNAERSGDGHTDSHAKKD